VTAAVSKDQIAISIKLANGYKKLKQECFVSYFSPVVPTATYNHYKPSCIHSSLRLLKVKVCVTIAGSSLNTVEDIKIRFISPFSQIEFVRIRHSELQELLHHRRRLTAVHTTIPHPSSPFTNMWNEILWCLLILAAVHTVVVAMLFKQTNDPITCSTNPETPSPCNEQHGPWCVEGRLSGLV
jgi:hypothetical protein